MRTYKFILSFFALLLVFSPLQAKGPVWFPAESIESDTIITDRLIFDDGSVLNTSFTKCSDTQIILGDQSCTEYLPYTASAWQDDSTSGEFSSINPNFNRVKADGIGPDPSNQVLLIQNNGKTLKLQNNQSGKNQLLFKDPFYFRSYNAKTDYMAFNSDVDGDTILFFQPVDFGGIPVNAETFEGDEFIGNEITGNLVSGDTLDGKVQFPDGTIQTTSPQKCGSKEFLNGDGVCVKGTDAGEYLPHNPADSNVNMNGYDILNIGNVTELGRYLPENPADSDVNMQGYDIKNVGNLNSEQATVSDTLNVGGPAFVDSLVATNDVEASNLIGQVKFPDNTIQTTSVEKCGAGEFMLGSGDCQDAGTNTDLYLPHNDADSDVNMAGFDINNVGNADEFGQYLPEDPADSNVDMQGYEITNIGNDKEIGSYLPDDPADSHVDMQGYDINNIGNEREFGKYLPEDPADSNVDMNGYDITGISELYADTANLAEMLADEIIAKSVISDMVEADTLYSREHTELTGQVRIDGGPMILTNGTDDFVIRDTSNSGDLELLGGVGEGRARLRLSDESLLLDGRNTGVGVLGYLEAGNSQDTIPVLSNLNLTGYRAKADTFEGNHKYPDGTIQTTSPEKCADTWFMNGSGTCIEYPGKYLPWDPADSNVDMNEYDIRDIETLEFALKSDSNIYEFQTENNDLAMLADSSPVIRYDTTSVRLSKSPLELSSSGNYLIDGTPSSQLTIRGGVLGGKFTPSEISSMDFNDTGLYLRGYNGNNFVDGALKSAGGGSITISSDLDGRGYDFYADEFIGAISGEITYPDGSIQNTSPQKCADTETMLGDGSCGTPAEGDGYLPEDGADTDATMNSFQLTDVGGISGSSFAVDGVSNLNYSDGTVQTTSPQKCADTETLLGDGTCGNAGAHSSDVNLQNNKLYNVSKVQLTSGSTVTTSVEKCSSSEFMSGSGVCKDFSSLADQYLPEDDADSPVNMNNHDITNVKDLGVNNSITASEVTSGIYKFTDGSTQSTGVEGCSANEVLFGDGTCRLGGKSSDEYLPENPADSDVDMNGYSLTGASLVGANELDATTNGVRFPDDTLQSTSVEGCSNNEVLLGDGTCEAGGESEDDYLPDDAPTKDVGFGGFDIRNVDLVVGTEFQGDVEYSDGTTQTTSPEKCTSDESMFGDGTCRIAGEAADNYLPVDKADSNVNINGFDVYNIGGLTLNGDTGIVFKDGSKMTTSVEKCGTDQYLDGDGVCKNISGDGYLPTDPASSDVDMNGNSIGGADNITASGDIDNSGGTVSTGKLAFDDGSTQTTSPQKCEADEVLRGDGECHEANESVNLPLTEIPAGEMAHQLLYIPSGEEFIVSQLGYSDNKFDNPSNTMASYYNYTAGDTITTSTSLSKSDSAVVTGPAKISFRLHNNRSDTVALSGWSKVIRD